MTFSPEPKGASSSQATKGSQSNMIPLLALVFAEDLNVTMVPEELWSWKPNSFTRANIQQHELYDVCIKEFYLE